MAAAPTLGREATTCRLPFCRRSDRRSRFGTGEPIAAVCPSWSGTDGNHFTAQGRANRGAASRPPLFFLGPGRERPPAGRALRFGHEQAPRTTGQRASDRRRRRHGRPPLRRRGRPSLPRGGKPPLAGERDRRPCELHRRRRRADRDQHLRGEPPQARTVDARARLRADQLDRCPPRPRGARGRRARGVHRGRDRPTRRARGVRPRRARAALRRAGADSRGSRDRPLHGRDVLRSRGARERAHRGSLGLVAADRGDAHLRRGRGDDRWDRSGGGSRTVGAARRRGDRDEPRRRAERRARGARPDGWRGRATRGAPERRSRITRRRQGHLPALDARVLRRVRRAGGCARGADRGWLLRDDACSDRGDPRSLRRGPRAEPSRSSRASIRSPASRPDRPRRRRSPARSVPASGS